jgi:hypothetical protein
MDRLLGRLLRNGLPAGITEAILPSIPAVEHLITA